MGRLWRVKLPDDKYQTNEFFPTGLLKKRTGAREYPVEYTYDHAGRVTTMTTWRDYPNQSAVKAWNYNAYRGWLDCKRYADDKGPDYTYTAADATRSGPGRGAIRESLDRMIEVVAGSCVEAYRYCGTDPEILRRLVAAGCREQCDALVRSRRDDVGY